MSEPLMRAMHIRENLEGVAALGDDIDARVRSELGQTWVELIEHAPRSKWLPLEVDIVLSRLVDEAAGREAYLEWSRAAILASAEKPLLRSFFRAGVRLLGGSPGSLIRLAQRGWQQIYREAGSLVVEPLEQEAARVRGVDLPEAMLRAPFYLDGIGAVLGVLPHFVGHVGHAVFEVEGGAVTWTVTWSPAP